MISRSVVLALLGTALLVANVNYVHADNVMPKGIIEVDDTNKPDNIEGEAPVTEVDNNGGHELPSFSTPAPTTEPPVVEEELPEEVTEKSTTEPPVVEQELPEDVTQKPTQPPKESHGLIHDLHNWIHGLGETWREQMNKNKQNIKDILGLGKKPKE